MIVTQSGRPVVIVKLAAMAQSKAYEAVLYEHLGKQRFCTTLAQVPIFV
jgi:hypothetical protein